VETNSKNKTIGVFGGGFKPPTKGHFMVAQKILEQNKNLDEFVIYVGGGERNGLSQEQSIEIWNIYKNHIPFPIKIEPSKSPIGDIIRFAKNNPDINVVMFLGVREGREDDLKDVSHRTKAKYPNLQFKIITTNDGMSGTKARQALKISSEAFYKFLPDGLSNDEMQQVYDIVSSNIEEEISPDILDSFKLKDHLVEEIWEDDKLRTEVREKLLQIAKDFFDSLGLPSYIDVEDITLTGSLANYNWSKFSDVDLHIRLDFSKIDNDIEFLKNYFLAIKSIWNSKHNIKMFGFPVEVYVENINEKHTASGLYSILKDEWINIPSKTDLKIDDEVIKLKSEDYFYQLSKLEEIFSKGKYYLVVDKIEEIKKKLRNMRSAGLEQGGEYSVENLTFKVLRRSGFIETLINLKTLSYDKMMSLEKTLQESSNYSEYIDYKERIIELAKFYKNKHPQIKELPKVIFKNNDKENAKDFLGKTAYYDPNTRTIVLYTEGRHPKDLVRSFSHEMIHFIQDVEGRLGDIQTTNTLEDDELQNIEQEAYLKGNINFRNWTDSLNEEKDPFGLNQFARELAQGLEETLLNEGKYTKLITQLTNFVFTGWKKQVDKGTSLALVKTKVNKKLFDTNLKFDLEASLYLSDKNEFDYDGSASPFKEDLKVEIDFSIDEKTFPEIWEEVSYQLSNILRHEIEHMTQQGVNVIPSKDEEIENDDHLRDAIDDGTIKKANYYTLSSEIDPMLQGIYTLAKKSKTPFPEAVDNFLDQIPKLTKRERKHIKDTWSDRLPALSLPSLD
jgi:hypothetical protein